MHKTLYEGISEEYEECKESKPGASKRKGADAESIEDAIIQFIIKERLPISKMNSPYFNNIIDGTHMLGICFVILFINLTT